MGLHASTLSVDHITAGPDAILQFQFTLVNHGPIPFTSVHLTNTLPGALTYVPASLVGSSGNVAFITTPTSGLITWLGDVGANATVTLAYRATVDPTIASAYGLVNQAIVDDQFGQQHHLQATVIVNPLSFYLPLITSAPGE